MPPPQLAPGAPKEWSPRPMENQMPLTAVSRTSLTMQMMKQSHPAVKVITAHIMVALRQILHHWADQTGEVLH